jgi:hypothetical protein
MSRAWLRIGSICVVAAVLLLLLSYGRYVDFFIGLCAGLLIAWALSLSTRES